MLKHLNRWVPIASQNAWKALRLAFNIRSPFYQCTVRYSRSSDGMGKLCNMLIALINPTPGQTRVACSRRNTAPQENVYPKGASAQFYKLFLDPYVVEQLKEYDAIASIEWDVHVAHASSFSRLYEAAVGSSEPFWVKGSTVNGNEFHETASVTELRLILGHLNGNAICEYRGYISLQKLQRNARQLNAPGIGARFSVNLLFFANSSRKKRIVHLARVRRKAALVPDFEIFRSCCRYLYVTLQTTTRTQGSSTSSTTHSFDGDTSIRECAVQLGPSISVGEGNGDRAPFD